MISKQSLVDSRELGQLLVNLPRASRTGTEAMRQANAKLLRKLAGGSAYQQNKAAGTN
jgi:hypothetical protein